MGAPWSCFDPAVASVGPSSAEGGGYTREEHFLRTDTVPVSQRDEKSLGPPSEKPADFPRVFLLGSSLGGKTTLFKQFIECYGSGLGDERDRAVYAQIVRNNVISGLKETIELSRILEVGNNDFEYAEAVKQAAETIVTWDPDSTILRDEEAQLVKTLFTDQVVAKSIHKMIENSEETLSYFLNELDRICASDGGVGGGYIPTVKDVFHANCCTSSAVEANIRLSNNGDGSGNKLTIVDFGGARPVRAEWTNSLSNLRSDDIALFVVGLTEYDENIREDQRTDRIVEALSVLQEIVNHTSIDIALVFTKRDLFNKKFLRVPLRRYYWNFSGKTPEDGINFLQDIFISKVPESRLLFTIALNATDSDDCKTKLFSKLAQRDALAQQVTMR
eukprot:TRINITY_DN7296_c0_g1_i1.p1 TRINITY_DN7296_c0_g1~~TRINITY_DN7296_c0_g1_i1.p1  ORF type:complete len:421 (-),score=79.42 TRINITY_DN7296_c0_g1_i1:64-1230(-)